MSRHKRQVFEQLIDEVQRSQLATDRFDQAVADAAGLNRTDMRCLDVLGREGPVTAGRLAEATGLTSGAMTTALDRLERAGLALRTRDAVDRRRVLVHLAADGRELVERVCRRVERSAAGLLGGTHTPERERLAELLAALASP